MTTDSTRPTDALLTEHFRYTPLVSYLQLQSLCLLICAVGKETKHRKKSLSLILAQS